jgi:hypothetical protein
MEAYRFCVINSGFELEAMQITSFRLGDYVACHAFSTPEPKQALKRATSLQRDGNRNAAV